MATQKLNPLVILAGLGLLYFAFKPKTNVLPIGPGPSGTGDSPPTGLDNNNSGYTGGTPSGGYGGTPAGGGPGNPGGGALIPSAVLTQNGNVLQNTLEPETDRSQGNLGGLC